MLYNISSTHTAQMKCHAEFTFREHDFEFNTRLTIVNKSPHTPNTLIQNGNTPATQIDKKEAGPPLLWGLLRRKM